MTAVSIFIAAVTILHILGYIGLVYWTTHIKAGATPKKAKSSTTPGTATSKK